LFGLLTPRRALGFLGTLGRGEEIYCRGWGAPGAPAIWALFFTGQRGAAIFSHERGKILSAEAFSDLGFAGLDLP